LWPGHPEPIIASMDHCGILHRIEDDLTENWLEAWVENGVQAIDGYLAKHLAFLCFLDDSK
jgi:hypothetical protein